MTDSLLFSFGFCVVDGAISGGWKFGNGLTISPVVSDSLFDEDTDSLNFTSDTSSLILDCK